MGWEDRDYDRGGGGGGGLWSRIERALSRGDLFSWSVPAGRVLGIEFRLHWFFLVFVIARLLTALGRDGGIGFALEAAFMSALFLIVALHEIGHCLACRRVGGEADRVLLWPLGGLAMVSPPQNWKAAFITTAGGPAVNVLLWPILGGVLLLWGAPVASVLWFNPFDPASVTSGPWFNSGSSFAFYAKVIVWWVYFLNLVLLAFNVLLPMFPMDGGRLLQEFLWGRIGYARSMRIATGLGMAAAIVVGVFAIVFEVLLLFAIALFAGITSWQERQRVGMIDPNDAWRDGPVGTDDPSEARFRKAAERERKQAERIEREDAEVDRILGKVREDGIGSLSKREKATLKRATERQRGS